MSRDQVRRAQLTAFLSSLPQGTAKKLYDACSSAQAAGDASLPYDLICTALAPKAQPALEDDPVFGAIAPLVREDMDDLRPGRILKSSLDAYADFAKRVAPELLKDVRSNSRSRYAGREALGEAMKAAIQEADEGAEGAPNLLSLLGGEKAADDARQITALLRAEPELSEQLYDIPERIKTLDEKTLQRIQRAHDGLSAKDAANPLLLLMLLMERLEKRWLIFRIVKAVSKKNDDLLLVRTDFSQLGDSLLDDAEVAVARMKADRSGYADADCALAALEQFASISSGMTRELGIRKDGAWGQRLQKLRHDVSENMDALCGEAARAVDAALPCTRVKLAGNIPATRPKTSPEPNESRFIRAEAFCRIVNESKGYASAAAFNSGRSKAMEDAEASLNEYCEGLIDEVHETDVANQAHLEPWKQAAVRLVRALSGPDPARIIQRRLTAAAANTPRDAA